MNQRENTEAKIKNLKDHFQKFQKSIKEFKNNLVYYKIVFRIESSFAKANGVCKLRGKKLPESL